MKILHTEASPGWGGQEIRILREAEGMRERGHHVILAVQEKGGLVGPAREAGFMVFEIPFMKSKMVQNFFVLMRLIRKYGIEIINTHSSLDAWLAGIVGKLSGCLVIRTRHLSTPIRKGLNSRILYNWLADYVVTTCQSVVDIVKNQANLPEKRCLSIPTGVNPNAIFYHSEEVNQFREKWGIQKEDFLVGTLCVLRGWKGVSDFLKAAKILEEIPNLKWVIVGSGVSESHFRHEWQKMGLEKKVIFTGYLSPPYAALAAMDLFLLLSFANEGVSQATLQAAILEKPLVTTNIGGLGEICLPNKTGLIVSPHRPEEVADAVLKMMRHPELRREMGKNAKKLVLERFTLRHTLDQMEALYSS